ncbi:MAG: chemotaxis protein CheA [Candidatus Margulisiibacteriota bacterium]|nr:MAG: hypothetical protein A2X43_01775 [Candidatus Margulisbacteria bacterium GWD2_39_127]OGI05487.1 MAG: hypothetical protein A2X42_00060 [Candidatus Margulisbacteria bacterium GWF2_38_17]OGI08315.1 MAG: hypothetical protein A2X41_00185 [Candidatus Margulisbacteria bacterium GWE2_39_32]PZM82311.1 MAG: chemotaxis protein CheA [Candidatus Margulisiibacteriota bacterium]HAR62943.1 chemotaxis protein CheA [Candidatus Margulisiibacteriota bacterium]
MGIDLGITEEELKVFLDDAEEQLQMLDENLIKLEKDPENESILQIIFRAAHTLKGGAATLGLTKMTELTHLMENIFDVIRKGQLAVTSDIVDVVFECLDSLRALKEDVSNNTDSDVNIAELVIKLNDFYSRSKGQIVTRDKTQQGLSVHSGQKYRKDISECFLIDEAVKKTIDEAKQNNKETYFIYSNFVSECQMKAVRAFQLINEILGVGEVLLANPPIEDIYSEKVEDFVALLVASDNDKQTIEQTIKTVDELANLMVHDVDLEERSLETSKEKNARNNETNTSSKLGRTVRVSVEKFDSLMNLVGELVIDRTRIYQLGSKLTKKYEDDSLIADMLESSLRIGRVTGELQEEIMKARMLPIGNVFSKFPRMVRDTANKCGKKIHFVIEGQATELDRSVIEEISDPLIHILRNAIDHGIEDPQTRTNLGKAEDGFVRLSAFHEDNYIVIRVEDDGRGIDTEALKKKAIEKEIITKEKAEKMSEKEAINLIFAPGLTTAEKLSDVSGRGVGMDIVRNNIEKINGQIAIESQKGKGSIFNIKLPLTLAIIQALLINVDKRVFAIPLISVQETIQIRKVDIKTIKSHEAIILRGNVLPLLSLKNIFYPDLGKGYGSEKIYIVVVSTGDKQVGFVVDSLVGEQEIVIKNLNKYIGDVRGISGATILGDGKVALIIDVTSLINKIIADQMAEEY